MVSICNENLTARQLRNTYRGTG